MECPRLLSRGNDLVRGQQEAVASSVSQLHGHRVRDAQLTKSPVQRTARGDVEQARDAANFIGLTVDGFQSCVGLVTNVEH